MVDLMDIDLSDIFDTNIGVETFGQLRTHITSMCEDRVGVEIRELGRYDPDSYEYFDDIDDVPHAYDIYVVSEYFYKWNTCRRSKEEASEKDKPHGFLKVTLDADSIPEIDTEEVPSYILQRFCHG